MGSGVGMTRGEHRLEPLVIYPLLYTSQFNLRLAHYHRGPHHRQDKDRHVAVLRCLPSCASGVSYLGISLPNAILTNVNIHTSYAISHVAQVILARMLPGFNPPRTSYDRDWQAGACVEPYGTDSYAPTSSAPQYATAPTYAPRSFTPRMMFVSFKRGGF